MFLYFAPKTSATVPPAAIAYAFERQPACRQVIANGPDGGTGMIYGERAERVGYEPTAQRWQRIPGTDCWCGWYTGEALPEPAALIRREQLAGHAITLGGGHSWLVPVARSVVTSDPTLRWVIQLPQSMELGDDGQWYFGAIVPRYRRLWDIASTWYDQVLRGRISQDEVDVELTVPEAISMACEVLQSNYRVGPVELSAMGAWESGMYGQVLDTLCDLPTLVEWLTSKDESAEKKSEPVASG